jgi:hypothetical protein
MMPLCTSATRPGAAWRVLAGAVAEVRVRVVHGRRAVRGPARVGDAGAAGDAVGGDLLHQFGDAVGAAGALQAVGIDGDAAGVIAAVFQALQALDQDGNDVARGNRADDAAHDSLSAGMGRL